ncbi:transcriptional regulator NanR [Aureimonas fodinaquatilis]|uniref:Transcriptional regulator NanR n=1 Tax=Aureimonas fodinaquatilis TaxID=2565783 RepID=A0A5B0DWN8_9HYPH|nr:transcriptional regulator NanR [Aureimonas fodinaquatilis]KAA0969619.1 transcriptional regulator NanR [Aureimonas fodinaquatilis]
MTAHPVEPIRRKKLYEEIVERLEHQMFSGELQPGSLLPSERELMERFQVGRTSVREALFALQRMGLIAIRNGERAYVTRPSAIRLVSELSGAARHMLADDGGEKEFQDARILLESALARDAARNASAEDIAMLKQALEQNESAIGDLPRFANTDVEFHRALVRTSRNSIFEALHEAVADWLSSQRLTSLKAEGSMADAFTAHGRIYDAIASRDPDEAEKQMAAHLKSVARYYWNARTGEQ